jgi:hypothetical protein
MIQEYTVPNNYQNYREFIPYSMYLNSRDCDRFQMIGICTGMNSLYQDEFISREGWISIFNKNRDKEIRELDIIPYLHDLRSAKFKRDLDEFLSMSTPKTDIVIDHLEYLEMADTDIVAKINAKYDFRLLTLVKVKKNPWSRN